LACVLLIIALLARLVRVRGIIFRMVAAHDVRVLPVGPRYLAPALD
jgi:hypothetical protein